MGEPPRDAFLRVVTPEEMREADRATIEGGTPGLDLMERAGTAAFEAIVARFGDPAGRRVTVCAGKGNNGGDGFVVARHLAAAGAGIRVVLSSEPQAYAGDAATNLGRLSDTSVELRPPESVWEDPALAIGGSDLLVDALLGTGASGPVRSPLDRLVNAMNDSGLEIVALDVPSGVDARTGAVPGAAIRAALTVTFAAPKSGLVFFPGREHAGEVRVVDIGVPAGVIAGPGPALHLATSRAMRTLLPRRAGDAHKGDAGRVLVAGGSAGLTGAVALAALGALRAGAGLVTAAVPRSLADILATKLTEVMTLACRETRGRALAEDAAALIVERADASDALVVGPGFSRTEQAAACAQEIVLTARVPTVVDADALNAFEGNAAAISDVGAPRILTPHLGEAGRLLGVPVREIRGDPLAAARRLAADTGAVVVLKGAPTLVAAGGEVIVNPTGNPGMATGGSGDVLAGMIAALLAQKLSPVDAAVLGVFLHGAAGDAGARRRTIWGLAAGDLPELLPDAFRALDAGERLESWIATGTGRAA